jgi:hypothetical protein
MRLSLIAAAMLVALGAPAAEGETEEAIVPGNGVPQPLSGNPGWRAQTAFGGGIVMLNSAGGQHTFNPEITAQAAWRANDLLTWRTRADFTHRKEGTDQIFVENTHTWLSVRPEGTLGTDRTQFVFGIGPSVIVTTTRLHAPGRNVRGNSFRPGFEYGAGLRWMTGSFPMGLDLSGQQRATRHDFRATLVFGIPVKSSKPASDEGKAGVR